MSFFELTDLIFAGFKTRVVRHFSNFAFFDNSRMDCTSNRIDCNVGLCGRFRGMLNVSKVKLTPGYMILYMCLFYKNTDILIS